MYNACEIDMNAIYVCFQNKKILGEVCKAPYTLGERRRACMSEAWSSQRLTDPSPPSV